MKWKAMVAQLANRKMGRPKSKSHRLAASPEVQPESRERMEATFMTPPKPVAKLTHEATHSVISVYKPIPNIQRWFIRVCFGLKYEKE